MTYSETITSETTLQVAAEIEAGVIFAKAKVTTTVTTSISAAFESSSTEEVSTQYSCDYYDNGDEFKSGCMWQLDVITTNEDKK